MQNDWLLFLNYRQAVIFRKGGSSYIELVDNCVELYFLDKELFACCRALILNKHISLLHNSIFYSGRCPGLFRLSLQRLVKLGFVETLGSIVPFKKNTIYILACKTPYYRITPLLALSESIWI